jgi:dienelactone hydrolase
MPTIHQPRLRSALLAVLATALLTCAALATSAQPRAHASAPRSPAAQWVSVPLPVADTPQGSASPARTMRTLVFKPQGPGPFPVLLYAHGRPAYASQRTQLVHPMSYSHVRYWLATGYAVVAPIRPGYGAASGGTGGVDVESSGAGYSSSGQCLRSPQPARTAQAAMQAQRAALDWVRQQPWAKANHIVLEGQSVGGLATVALCAASPPGVKGCINFSGGAGGDPVHAPGRLCAPEQTTQLMRGYGHTTQVPSIWLYAANDLYWGAEPPRQWHAAFAQAASATAPPSLSTFVQTPPVGSDGHSLLRAGSAQWGPPLAAWLRKNHL